MVGNNETRRSVARLWTAAVSLVYRAIFTSLKGVISAMPGYTGGAVKNPTYEQVCNGNTGHVEATKIEFDPAIISYEDLLSVFSILMIPRPGIGKATNVVTQYRNIVFYYYR